jgi:hypothetical protein
VTETKSPTVGETAETVLLDWVLIDRACSARGAHTGTEKADLLGVGRASLYRWQAGHNMGLRQAMKIAERLGMSLADIIADGPRPPAGPQTPPPPPAPKESLR